MTTKTEAATDINLLLDQYKVLRILQPSLRQQIERVSKQNPALQNYVLYHQGELYLSLEEIENLQRREQTYAIIQSYQIDTSIELDQIPAGLYACLAPKRNRRGRLVGAMTLGALGGLLVGLAGITLALLFTAVFNITDPMTSGITFIATATIGWAAGTYYFWYKYPLGFWGS